MYCHITLALSNMGYTVNRSPLIDAPSLEKMTNKGIIDNSEDLYIYNHTYIEELKEIRLFRGPNVIILKPTAPTPAHFTIDPLGYAAASSITYNKPDYEGYDSTSFFSTEVPKYIEERQSKWSDREEFQFSNKPLDVPNNHVLVIGQMPGDETVTKMSFGDHWNKFCSIVDQVKNENPVVVKIHPTLKREAEDWSPYKEQLDKWQSEGIVVFQDFESLYDILPKTCVAIIENSTAGIECMMHNVPIISYGYPEYHWVTKDLRHLTQLRNFVEDLSWYNEENARSFIAWYCQQYQCYDYESTFRRLKELLSQNV